MNAYAPCNSCNAHLKLLYRYTIAITLLFGVALLIVHFGIFVAVIAPAFVGAFGLFGFWGLLFLPILMVLHSLISLVFVRYYYPLFREVVVL